MVIELSAQAIKRGLLMGYNKVIRNMNSLLLNISSSIKTPRLLLRPPHQGDGMVVNEAIRESFQELNKWMAWAKNCPTMQETELFVRESQARFILREELLFFIFDHHEKFLGSIGFHNINWSLPSFESGYWVRTSCANQGIITEAAQALWLYAFNQLGAVRIMLTMDEDNKASRRIPEKLGFTYEGTLMRNTFKCDGKTLRNTVIYARYNKDGL